MSFEISVEPRYGVYGMNHCLQAQLKHDMSVDYTVTQSKKKIAKFLMVQELLK